MILKKRIQSPKLNNYSSNTNHINTIALIFYRQKSWSCFSLQYCQSVCFFFFLFYTFMFFLCFFITLSVSGSRQNEHGFNIVAENDRNHISVTAYFWPVFRNKAAGLRRKLAGQMIMTVHTWLEMTCHKAEMLGFSIIHVYTSAHYYYRDPLPYKQ